jgi:hypothetical protein
MLEFALKQERWVEIYIYADVDWEREHRDERII